MKKLILILLFILPLVLFGQQINHTWGYETDGTAYTETGSVNVDSAASVTTIFDMQDYFYLDYNPLVPNDSAVYALNSDRLNYGTFWYKFDLENATDSVMYTIKVYPGFMDYHPNDESRITVANIDYSTTATTLVDTTSDTWTTNDIQWTAVNVYISDAEGKILPPEFLKVVIDFQRLSCDSVDVYKDFVYSAVYEEVQDHRRTTRTNGEARKQEETLH